MLEFAYEYEFSILNSTPYYAQANGQAESTNKVLKLNIQKKWLIVILEFGMSYYLKFCGPIGHQKDQV